MKLTTMALLGGDWQTEQADLLGLAARSPIPRREAIRMQFRRDATSWEMWLLVSIAVAALGFGLPLLNAGLVFWGGVMALILIYVFVEVTKGHTRATLLRGVISDPNLLRRHAMGLGHVTVATLSTSETPMQAPVFIGRKEAVELLRRHGRIEVLVHYDPKVQYSTVLAWREAA